MTFLGSWALIALVITFKKKFEFMFALIGGYRGKQFKFIPFPSALNIILGVSSLDCNMSTPYSNNLQRGEQIDFRRLFQKDYTTIPFLASSFDSHWACLKSYIGLGMEAWLFTRPIILCFHLPSSIFSSTLRTKLHLPLV